MKYKGIQSAKAIMESGLQNSIFSIIWEIDTKAVFNRLFKIHNTYQSEFSLYRCSTLETRKEIDQKNIQQNLTIKYDWEKLTAFANVDTTWEIPSQGCYDLLSMIYMLRTIEPTKLDSCRFVVDIEGRIWKVKSKFLGKEKSVNDFGISTLEKVELTFAPFGKTSKRKWKTDLLNNRLSKPNARVQIWLGPFPQRLPLAMTFGTNESSVEMNLKKFVKTEQ